MSNNIEVDVAGLFDQVTAIDREVFPRLREAVGQVAVATMKSWADAIQQAPGVWSQEKADYIKTLKWEYTGEFSARISSNYQYADEIDNGRPARDLKRMLDTSPKVRTTKSGKRYLMIPFRHNTPGQNALAPAMPPDIYAQAKQLAPSRVAGSYPRQSGLNASSIATRRPMMVKQAVYNWGDSLPGGLAPKLKPHHATDIYAGMYRFDTSSGKQKSSAYVTFRTMMEGSPKWIVPAKPGLYLVQKITTRLQPLAEQVFSQAVTLDLGG